MADAAESAFDDSFAYAAPALDPAAEAALAAAGWSDPELDRAIAAGDEMLAWGQWHRHGSLQQALVGYFVGGTMAARAVEAVLDWRFGPSGRPRVLDFASGWGRVTRFLVRRRPAGDLTVSDIDAGAVAFQRRRFGVGGFASAARPADLPCDERFDAIVVLSLFSHLPEESFRAWLERLLGLLAPGGVLLFSVLGEAALLPGRSMPPGGFHFETLSETDRLEKSAYGSAWVSEAWLGETLARLAGPGLAWRHLPSALWHLQDLVLVVPDGGADVDALVLPDEPRGALDSWRRRPDGAVELGGWAATAAGPARRVEVRVGERLVAEVAPGIPRPDAAALVGPAAADCGWHALLPTEVAARAGEVLLVVAESGDGTRGALHASPLAAAAEHVAYANALAIVEAERHRQGEELGRQLAALGWQAESLRRQLAHVEASRFWKARNAWFAFKRRLGLAPPL